MFAYAAGLSLSLEKNPSRRSFIPVYGLEAGGFVHQLMGNPFFVTPYAGLHLFADRDVFITARGGYRLVPSQFTRLSGWHAVLAADVGLW
jgi:hypothetical protein